MPHEPRVGELPALLEITDEVLDFLVKHADAADMRVAMRGYATRCIAAEREARKDEARWISVDERLPEVGSSVAFVSQSRDSFYDKRVLGGVYLGSPLGGFCVPGLCLDASHWMPLPAPPAALQAEQPEGS